MHEPGQLRMLETARLDRPLTAWLKIDSGMGRLGFRPEAAPAAYARLADCAAVGEIRLMTHLASADAHEPPDDRSPARAFRGADERPAGRALPRQLRRSSVGPRGTAASGCAPASCSTASRRSKGRTGPDEGLRPVMTLATRLIAVKEVQAGDTVGYAATWRAARPTRIGIAAIGYGDGYPRHAPSGTPVLVAGRAARLAGRVSMDMIALDLTDVPEAEVGTPVTLWGSSLPVETIATAAGTIAYELLCGITGRVHVQVTDEPPA